MFQPNQTNYLEEKLIQSTMGCIQSREAASIVEIRRKRKSVRERISGFISKRRRRVRENSEQALVEPPPPPASAIPPPPPPPPPSAIPPECDTDSLGEEVDELTFVVRTRDDDEYSYSLRCEETPVPMDSYSDVSVTEMIDMMDRSRSRAQKQPSLTSVSDDVSDDESDHTLQSVSVNSGFSTATWTARGNVPSVNSSFEDGSICRPHIATPVPQYAESREDFQNIYYRVATPHRLKPSYAGMSIEMSLPGSVQEDIPEEPPKAEARVAEIRSKVIELAKKSASNFSATLSSQETAKKRNTGIASEGNVCDSGMASGSGTPSTSYADTPKEALGAVGGISSPSPPPPPKMFGRSKQDTAKEMEKVLLEAENKPAYRPTYVIDTRDLNVRPSAARGARAAVEDDPSTSGALAYSQLRTRVKKFNKSVDKLMETDLQQSQPSEKPYNISKRPKAARGVRSIGTSDSNEATAEPPQRSYTLRPQLTVPRLRLPEQDALDKFIQYQEAKEERRNRESDGRWRPERDRGGTRPDSIDQRNLSGGMNLRHQDGDMRRPERGGVPGRSDVPSQRPSPATIAMRIKRVEYLARPARVKEPRRPSRDNEVNRPSMEYEQKRLDRDRDKKRRDRDRGYD